MPALHNELPPPYPVGTKDTLLNILSHASTPMNAKDDAHVPTPTMVPDPTTSRQIWRERKTRLKKRVAKALVLGAGAIALTVAVPIVLAVKVVFEGKIFLEIVGAPFVLCVFCFSMEDSDP